MKTCTKCGEVKDLAEFRKKQGKCAPCQDAYQKENYAKNREGILARMKTPEYLAAAREKDKKRYREKPGRKEHAMAAATKYRLNNPDRRKETNARWNAKPQSKVLNAIRRAKRGRKIKYATPAWADLIQIAFMYASMSYLRQEGLDVHVDHIVPVQGRNVSGLHVHNNLRLMFAALNHSKSNKFTD